MIIIISPLDIKDLSFRLCLSFSLSLFHCFPSSSLSHGPRSLTLCPSTVVFTPFLCLARSLYPSTILSFAPWPFLPAFLSFRSLFLSQAARAALGFREMTIYKLLPSSLI